MKSHISHTVICYYNISHDKNLDYYAHSIGQKEHIQIQTFHCNTPKCKPKIDVKFFFLIIGDRENFLGATKTPTNNVKQS